MKRALCIGINDYPGTGQDLHGCVNDANDWKATLEERGFDPIGLLIDGDASKANMVEAFKQVVADTGPDDLTVITFSGHGTWVPDVSGDEADGRDEALCPQDISGGQLLTDDEMYDIFSQRQRSARIVLISDSCHSGTVTRASVRYAGEEQPEQVPRTRFLSPLVHMERDNIRMHELARRVERIRTRSKIRSAVVLMSGCDDMEYSYDAWFGNRPNGAFTKVATAVLKELDPQATYLDWHRGVRELLPSVNFPQTPQLQAAYYQKNWKVFVE